jgi:hypothetical protein
MSRGDAVLLASPSLGVLLTVWVLVELTYVPGTVLSFIQYDHDPAPSAHAAYMHHSYLISLGFLITRIIGLSLMARWLHRGGPEVEELLLPVADQRTSAQV